LVLLVGGTDPLAYSGLEADLRHLDALGIPGIVVESARTTQSLGRLLEVDSVGVDEFSQKLKVAVTRAPSAVKIGMLHRAVLVAELASTLKDVGLPIVLDPVLASSSGAPLLDQEGINLLKSELGPLAALITPNWDEAKMLTGESDCESAIRCLLEMGASAVLIKGGHRRTDDVEDRFAIGEGRISFRRPRISNVAPRGTGCALATVIAGLLCKGYELEAAVTIAGDWVHQAIKDCSARGTRFLVLPKFTRTSSRSTP
jgi:hydroxymethylpyrimidine kinase/phosphomethylpyrimidine kinase